MNDPETHSVYSTSFGPLCPACAQPKDACVCAAQKKAALPPAAGKVRLRHETAGRKGKGVTLITGLPLSQDAMQELARKLKSQLGTGGAVKEYTIELQGDQREKARKVLSAFGYMEKE